MPTAGIWDLKTDEVDAFRDLNNHKPYRTPEQKIEARQEARKRNGTWRSAAPRSYHPLRKDLMGKTRRQEAAE